MQDAARRFLTKLLETPAPSGSERPVQELVRDYAGPFADKVATDVHGNVVAVRNPQAKLRVMLAGHCDQIGMLVTQIDDTGFICAQPIGAWDPQQLVGQRMTIWGASGPIAAVIARKPIHLLNEQDRKQAVRLQDLWLDIGAKDKEDASRVVQIGDPATLKLGVQEMRNELLNAPGMDDKAGLWVVMETLRRVSQVPLRCALFAVSTVQEEIGLRGARTSAFSIDPHVGIAVDATHATDCPTMDKHERGDIALGRGPVIFRGPNMNPIVTQRLTDVCSVRKIPFQLSASGRAAANDANSIQVNRAGVATGLVSIPSRYMHSAVETISLRDIDDAADLLTHFVAGLSGDEDFSP
jgi:endoglucanase